MLKILIATNNLDKIKEYQFMFKDYPIKIYSLKDFNIEDDPLEDGKSYQENAHIKIKAIENKIKNILVMSDDSGIEIDSMGEHSPGIYSKRYAQNHGYYKKVNKDLCDAYHGSKARYVCNITLLDLDRNCHDFEGIMEGKISTSPKGDNGFGYDPIFIKDGESLTNGEISDDIKNSFSHRKKALDKLISFLKENKYL